jgi:thiol-disulfide isomerase/thioredoxin
VIGAGLALVVALAIVAVVASRGGSNGGGQVAAGNGPALQQARAVTVTGTALPAFTSSSVDAAAGRSAPELRGQSFDGTPVTVLDDGAPKLVMFLAHWCPHCQKEVPVVTQYLAAHAVPAGLQLRAVATSTSADRPNFPPSSWLQREQWPVPTIADDGAGTAADAYGLTSFPYFVAIDGGGKVVARASGELSTGELQALLDRAAA